MENLFNIAVNMSVSASIIIVIVLVLRQCTKKKVSKSFVFLLWGIVFLKLIMPFGFESSVSVFNYIQVPKLEFTEKVIGNDETVDKMSNTEIDSRRDSSSDYDGNDIDTPPSIQEETTLGNEPIVSIDNNLESSILREESNKFVDSKDKFSANVMIKVLSYIWFLGIFILLVLLATMYVLLRRKLKDAILDKRLEGGIKVYKSNKVTSPLLLGILKPIIIIPKGLELEAQELEFVLQHEIMHMKRFDHLIKPFTLFITCIHWFNPLVWMAYWVFIQDMELSCDEKVLQNYDNKTRCLYANTLLKISMGHNNLSLSGAVAFSENNTTSRVKSILRFKRIPLYIKGISVVILIMLAITLISNPKGQASHNKPINNEDLVDENLNETVLDQGQKSMEDGNGVDEESVNTVQEQNQTQEQIQIHEPLNIESFSQEEVNQLIEEKIEIIMSSPMESSNPGDYIEEHRHAFDQVVEMDTTALTYLFSEFEKGGERGLKGHIMAAICHDILWGEDISLAFETGQEWYDEIKAHVIRLAELNGDEFMVNNYPKSSIILSVMSVYPNEYVDIVNYSDGMVEINGDKIGYDNTGIDSVLNVISYEQIDKMMYRSIMFYMSANTRDYGLIEDYLTNDFAKILSGWYLGDSSDEQVDLLMNIAKATPWDEIISMNAPHIDVMATEGGRYNVLLVIEETLEIEVNFELDTNGEPKIDGCNVIDIKPLHINELVGSFYITTELGEYYIYKDTDLYWKIQNLETKEVFSSEGVLRLNDYETDRDFTDLPEDYPRLDGNNILVYGDSRFHLIFDELSEQFELVSQD